MKFIPKNYKKINFENFVFFHHPEEGRVNIYLLTNILADSLLKVKNLLDFKPNRVLNFCMFLNEEDSFKGLDRKVSNSMLMMPFSTARESLIIFHSPSANEINANQKRMARHLTHEIIHCLNAEKTCSTKILGDSNKNMKIPEWLDEGFAEIISSEINNRNDIIDHAIETVSKSKGLFGLKKINQELSDFSSPQREIAFSYAIYHVHKIIRTSGIRNTFKNLDRVPLIY